MMTKDNGVSYAATLEDETEVVVTMEVISSDDKYKPYGIKSVMKDKSGRILDSECAENIFATSDEAEKIIEMLCELTVFPSTLKECV